MAEQNQPINTTNISKKNRDEMLSFLKELACGADSSDKVRMINRIASALQEKSYGLVWEQHTENVDQMLADNIPVFTEDDEKRISLSNNAPYNFLLEGDNLHSLMLLEKSRIKVDVIYIDPPYNTLKKDFKYDDKMVDENDKYPHSKWLSFMQRRLKIARNIMSNDGVMFISIDDHEYANLKLLCDDIFGEKNVDTMIWRKSGVGRDGKMKNTTTFRKDHEYVIVCFKSNKYLNKIKELPSFTNEYSNADNDPRGPWMSGSLSRSDKASNPSHPNYYTVISPSGKSITRQFEIPKDEFDKLNADKRISWGKNGDSVPRIKVFINEEREVTPYSMLLTKGTTTEGTKELNEMLGADYTDMRPKPSSLIKALLQIASKEDSICLDFFAGSGTTGQAVMELNKDGGNRRFILCTNNEDKICEDVTYKRLHTVITGTRPDASEYSNGISANLKYFRTDFVNRHTEIVPDELADHSAEMVELEKGIHIEDFECFAAKNILLKNDEDADFVYENFEKYNHLQTIYIIEDTNESDSVLLTNTQLDKFKSVKIVTVPRWYFESEIMEAK